MYELKTKPDDTNVLEFIHQIENDSKREDALILLDIFSEVTGEQPVLWAGKMIGFGTYHYKYKTGHEGTVFKTGFAIQKTKLTLYITLEEPVLEECLGKLGKCKNGKSCVYVNKLADIDLDVLKKMIKLSYDFVGSWHPELNS